MDAFDVVHAYLQGELRGHDYHCDCPFEDCRKPAKPGQTHFSYSHKGYCCFVCGRRGTLRQLVEILRLETKPAPRSRTVYHDRQPHTVIADFGRLANRCEQHKNRIALWQAYKPLAPETITAYRLGVGTSRCMNGCTHERLMVPLIAEGKVIGMRARAISCNCTRWISPAGSKLVLYNGERLQVGPGMGFASGKRPTASCVLFIVENPIDALLLEERYPWLVAVATLGIAIWQEHWTDILRRLRFHGIIIAYDNDVWGNGGNSAAQLEWQKANPGRSLPTPAALRLQAKLAAAGIHAELFVWPRDLPSGTDIGSLIQAGGDMPLISRYMP